MLKDSLVQHHFNIVYPRICYSIIIVFPLTTYYYSHVMATHGKKCNFILRKTETVQ